MIIKREKCLNELIEKQGNKQFKYDYKEEVKDLGNVLLVNSYCLDENKQELAKGGCCYFKDGSIKEEIKAGIEGVLVVDIR